MEKYVSIVKEVSGMEESSLSENVRIERDVHIEEKG